MAKTAEPTPRKGAKPGPKPGAKAAQALPQPGLIRRGLRWLARGVLGVTAFYLALILLYTFVNPPTDPYIFAESRRLGGVERQWVPLEAMAPDLARSVVAAEDANFCLHWGFDMVAIRQALDEGGGRGASTISQQVVKNVFLWQGRSWLRKAMEATLTPVVELVWTKRRIIEVYLNVAEFGEGVFGAEAAAQHHFRLTAAELTATQSSRLAAVLPDPKGRDAANPSSFVRKRAAAARDGAETILADGRSACFED